MKQKMSSHLIHNVAIIPVWRSDPDEIYFHTQNREITNFMGLQAPFI